MILLSSTRGITVNKSALMLFIAQIIAHLGFISMFFFANFQQWLICFFIYFLTGCLGMSMTFHRLLSHRSWVSPQWFKYLGTILGSLGLTGSALAWVSVHRQHHNFPDKKGDPHSPHVQKWWHVQFLSMFYKPRLRIAKDLLRDRFIVFMHRNYIFIQLTYITTLSLIDSKAIIYAYLAPATLLWHGGSLINTLGHKWGYTNFSIKDKSVNNFLLGILMWGEGWHNNHHARPAKSKFGIHPWEIDISFLLISIIETKRKTPRANNKSY